MTLFTPPQLSAWLQYPVETAAAEIVERVVAGWLLEATGLASLPSPPPELFSWALELGGIAYENPTSMSTDQAADVTQSWGDRRSQILRSAAKWAQRVLPEQAPSSTVGPRGSFPAARSWPDPAGPSWLA